MAPLQRLGLASLALALTGCAQARRGVGAIWALTRDSGSTLILHSIGWTLAGVAAGVGLTWVAYQLSRRWGWYRLDGTLGEAARLITVISLITVFGACGGLAGFFEGLYRGTREVLTGSSVVTGYYPALGGVGADALGAVYYFDAEWRDQGSAEAASERVLDRLSEFREGRVEIPAAQARARLQQVSDETVGRAFGAIEGELQQRFPSLATGRGAQLARFFLDLLRRGVSAGAHEQAEEGGWLDWLNPVARLITRLPEVGAREGDPLAISHAELATFLVEETLVRSTLAGIKLFCRGNSLLMLSPIPVFWLLTPLGFLVARGVRSVARPAPVPPPDAPVEGP